MVTVLDELDLSVLVTTIPGLSAVGSVAILAETGDLTSFTRRGRPGLRTAGGRRCGLPTTHKVYAARYRHLTTREKNKLKANQAQTVIAAAMLRPLHAVVVHRQAWDPVPLPRCVAGAPRSFSTKASPKTGPFRAPIESDS